MLYLIDQDGVRTRVNRKLFAQAMPDTRLKCASELSTVLSESAEDKFLRVVVNLEGIDPASLEEWIDAMNRRHARWSWFAFLNRNQAIPDWLPALQPTGILCEPMDMHVVKQALSLVSV